MTYTCGQLREKLFQLSEKPLTQRLNKNKSTFVKVEFCTPVSGSLHEGFLKAPDDIISSLSSYIQGKRVEEEKLYNYMVRYLRTQAKETLSIQCSPKGTTYDLDSLYQDLNQKFFHARLSLLTTWWKKRDVTPTTSCTLGVFLDTLQLIKIHSLLDSPRVPQYVVENILYHEMLHAVVQHKRTTTGRIISHTREFRSLEKQYPHFDKAEQWLFQNKALFLTHRTSRARPA